MHAEVAPENRTDKKRSAADNPWLYVTAMLIVLISMVLTILLPSYWNFRLRNRQIDWAEQVATAAATTPKGAAQSQPSNQTAPALGGVTANQSTENSTLPHRTDSASAREIGKSEGEDLSRMFDTYARLLTMLVAVLSGFGVFFGFFVRKSIREVEDDIRKDSKERLLEMTAKNDELKTYMNTLKGDLESRAVELSELVDKSKGLISQLNEALERSSAEAERVASGAVAPAQVVEAAKRDEVAAISDQIDEELEKEDPHA